MRKALTYLYLLASLILFAGCIREDLPEPESGLLGGESWVIIPFCADASEAVQVTTKSTLNIVAESRISNIYLFLFDGNGNRLFGQFFDSSNLDTQANVEDLSVIANNWWVNNSSDLSDPLGDTNPSTRTRGGIRIKAPNIAGAKLYAVANIDGDVVNVSPERLGLVQNIAQLNELTAVLKQDVISRNGQFTMVAGPYTVSVQSKDGSGRLQDILSGGKNPGFEGDTWRMEFERVDAKIEVRVRYLSGENQRIKEFIPESWQVINVPKACTLIAPDNYASTFDLHAANEAGYKDTPPVAFESAIENAVGGDIEHLHSFSFYMLENREAVKKDSDGKTPSTVVEPLPFGITNRYHLRDLRLKDSSGHYTTTEGDMWTYAPQYSTYIIIKGEVKMNISVADQMDQALNAYVTYVFHLGDFAASVDDFNVERNTVYTYTLTINDVNNIQYEVSTSNPDKYGPQPFKEANSGAMGMLNLVRQSSYTFDAHYGQRAFCFDAEMIDWAANPEDMNTRWYVKTPFGKTGSPERLGDTDIPSNYDYQWVHFMVNSFCEDEDINATTGRRKDYADSLYKKTMANVDWYNSHPDKTPYKQNNQQYRTGVAMRDVVEFCRYMREQKRLLYPNGVLDPTGGGSDFRPEWAPEWEAWARKQCEDGGIYSSLTPEQQEAKIIEKATRWRIWVTCYVDEYYYEEHPITHEDMRGTDFWKQFCNKPDRIMMILCDNEVSLDGDSDYTGSIITIIQHSIQTPYTLNRASLKSAWGAEVVDETFGYGWFYSMGGLNDNSNSNNSKYESTSSDKIPTADYIDLPVNTSDNGLYNSVSNWQFIEEGSFKSGLKWEDYLDHEVLNDEPYVRLRTHDNDGNEIHPSIASLRMACLMRNRDLNGNGTIEPGEIRWYMASSEQVYGLFLGGMGLTEMAQTYTRANANMSGKYYDPKHGYGKKNAGVASGVDNWRLHIVTSSIYKKGDSGSSTASSEQTLPHVILAEEAVGGTPGAYRSDYNFDNNKKQARYSARCVRNLGMNDNRNNLNDNTVVQPDQNIPEKLIKVKSFTSKDGEDLINTPEDNKATDGHFVFDCANINEVSVRFKTSRELEASDQFSEISRLYKGFETGPLVKNIRKKKTDVFTSEEIAAMAAVNNFRPTSYDVLHKMLSLNQSPCPEGWRVPNIREASVMVLFGKSAKWWQNTYIISGTWSANGYNYGNQNDYNSTKNAAEKNKDSWRINRTSSTAFRFSLGQVNNDNDAIRCVRDIDPE